MLKAAGSILIIAATTLWGMRAAERVREQYEQMRLLQSVLYALRGEILYARSYLGEAFAKIGSSSPEPYRKWLTEISRAMDQKSGMPFWKIWEDGIRLHLKDSGLPERDRCRLEELGRHLGNTDLESQLRSMDLYLNELGKSMEEKREGMKTRVRLCHCLGVMSGIFIAILLI